LVTEDAQNCLADEPFSLVAQYLVHDTQRFEVERVGDPAVASTKLGGR
jgi:hypothetical protein